jgi:hypothetical protein
VPFLDGGQKRIRYLHWGRHLMHDGCRLRHFPATVGKFMRPLRAVPSPALRKETKVQWGADLSEMMTYA